MARNDGRRAVGPASGRLRSGVSGQSGGSLACEFGCQTELRGMALRRAKVFCDELRMRKRCWRLSAPSPYGSAGGNESLTGPLAGRKHFVSRLLALVPGLASSLRCGSALCIISLAA